jgi:uncharacterized membrane protein
MLKYIAIAFIMAVTSYFLRDTVVTLGYAAYKDTLGALLNISSIIFAIIGAWIAIIYPRAIGRVFKSSPQTKQTLAEADTDAEYLSELVEIVLVSAIVLMMVLVIQFVAPLFASAAKGQILTIAKFGLFYVVAVLTLSQIHAVFRVILANYYFLNELRKKNVTDKITDLNNR